MATKQKEVDQINARYDDDKRRYAELTKGAGATAGTAPATPAKK